MNVDTDVYYVRFGESFEDKEGMLTTFPKAVLNDMQLLKGAKEDLGADVGTEEKPFFLDLHALSPDDFDKVITLIEQVRNFIARNPQQNNNASAIQQFLWSSNMGGILNTPDRYTRLTMLLSCGNYLGINSVIIDALKLCITIPPRGKSMILSEDLGGGMWGSETLDRALKAGLKNIDKLPNDLLIPIKETIIRPIALHIETEIVKKINEHTTKHKKIMYELPPELKANVMNGSFLLGIDFVVETTTENFGVFTTDKEKSSPAVKRLKLKGSFHTPKFNFLGQIPNQHLVDPVILNNRFNFNAMNIPLDEFIPDLPIFLSSVSGNIQVTVDYVTYFAEEDEDEELGIEPCVSNIFIRSTKQWVSIPNFVQGLATFIS